MNNDLISRKALLEVLRGLKPSGFEQSFAGQAAIRYIEAAPAVDAELVRRGTNKDACYPSLFECSECGWECTDTYSCDTAIFRYCPNCGAKMEEDG